MRTALFRLHRAVIDPSRGGALLALLRGALLAASAGYGLAVRARNALYRCGCKRSQHPGVPVISVGNVTAGGTGKTPLVAWLARLLVIRRMRPAILSRGYGRHEGLDVDDENAMLARMAPDVPVVVDPDRLRGARTARREHAADALILDDGFQHRRIARDLDVVLVDALHPFGAGHLLPRGLLREPLAALRRADVLLVTRADLVEPQRLDEIKERLRELSPDAPLACCRTVPTGLRPLGGGAELPCEELGEGRWAAFCGIGNPDGFRRSLQRAGCRLAALTVFSDHERYSAPQVRGLLEAAGRDGCDRVVTTEKDAVKVAALLPDDVGPPVYSLQAELDFTEGSKVLTGAVLEAVGEAR
jgi:tetraacyldisaccharide 4'-kinase